MESVLELGPVNASSVHRHGRVARRVVEEARAEVALLLEVEEAEIILTGSATESNNLALRGITAGLVAERTKIVSTAIEHPSVLGALDVLEARGYSVSRVGVDLSLIHI